MSTLEDVQYIDACEKISCVHRGMFSTSEEYHDACGRIS